MKFGIKFKILLGISFLLVTCTVFNLVYSYRLFVEDKTSYIFEEGLKKAESLSEQLNSKINDITVRSEFHSLLIDNPKINFKKLIDNQREIVTSGILSFKNNQPLFKSAFLNDKSIDLLKNDFAFNPKEIDNELIKNLNSISFDPKGIHSKTWIFSPKPRLKLLMHLSSNGSPSQIIFTVSNLSGIVDSFIQDHSYTNKIISLDNDEDRNENKLLISKIDFNKSKKGAFEANIKNKDYLISYSFVNEKVLILSAIDKNDAFSITQYLILKTSLFALFLIGLGIIVGIYFSSSITFPILKLTEIANKIAAGDFSTQAQIKTNDEVKVLGETFNFMSSEIRALLKTKEEFIEKLEEMVAQRTLELKEANDFMALMINSLDQGLLVFDKDLHCKPNFTKACIPIFGLSPLDKSLPELFKQTEDHEVDNLKQWSQILFSEMLPFENAADLGCKRIITGKSYTDLDYKNVQIDYYPMRDADQKISNVVMVATDKTREVQAMETAKEKEAYVSMILKILNNKTQFESFVLEVDDIFDQLFTELNINKNKVDLGLVMMLFHSLNGGFSIYSITKLQQIAVGYETGITAIKESNLLPSQSIPLLLKNATGLKQDFYNFRLELDSLLGTRFATNQSIAEIPRIKINELKTLVRETQNQNLIQYFEENFVKTPVIKFFKGYDDLCKVAASKVHKEFNGLRFTNSELLVEAEPLLEFFNVLVHLFRNCIDHGLETPDLRAKIGKSTDGHIDVKFEEVKTSNGNIFKTIISDDGNGINPEIIRNRFKKLNPDIDISSLSDKEVVYKIFDPFFSTREVVSELSGRGVGMSAIKDVVDRLHGKIDINSTVGSGSIFTFEIPI